MQAQTATRYQHPLLPHEHEEQQQCFPRLKLKLPGAIIPTRREPLLRDARRPSVIPTWGEPSFPKRAPARRHLPRQECQPSVTSPEGNETHNQPS